MLRFRPGDKVCSALVDWKLDTGRFVDTAFQADAHHIVAKLTAPVEIAAFNVRTGRANTILRSDSPASSEAAASFRFLAVLLSSDRLFVFDFA